MSAVATAGAVAWVVPEILTAKPAAGAALSTPTGGGGGGGVSTTGVTTPATTASTTSPGSSSPTSDATTASTGPGLAFTGDNIQRDVEIGAALIAGGWAMHHWASRTPEPAAESAGRRDRSGRPRPPGRADDAGSTDKHP
jgi:hypothetical protein